MRERTPQAPAPRRDQGFTIIEVLVAILILMFGMMAITNLFIVAGSSNMVSRTITASSAQAAEALDRLKEVPFTSLAAGGGGLDLDADGPDSDEDTPITLTDDAGAMTTWAADRNVGGVGQIRVRWQVAPIDQYTLLIRVVAAAQGPLVRARSRVELTSFRTCTGGRRVGCPD